MALSVVDDADRLAVQPDSLDRARTVAWAMAIALTAAASWLAVTGFRALAAGHELWPAVRDAQGQMTGPVIVLVVAAVFVAERLWPAVPRPALARAHVVDAGYLLLFASIIGPLVTLLDTGFAVEVERHAGFLVLGRLPLLPQLIAVALIVIGMDAMNWVAHVGNHRSASLWRFHALHHSQEDMNVFTTFRTHPLSHASYLPAVLPALVLGASGTVPAAALIAYACFVTLPHANLRWTFGPVGRVLVSPAYHRLHHASGMRPVNFGFVLVCWDRLAGCAMRPVVGDPVATGIAGRPVPIEQDAPSGLARVVAAQLVQPFRISAAMDGRP
jgi:sterol desaturase/sphingolipid hydroxylase (fatty acid hydroxylase superfamily)